MQQYRYQIFDNEPQVKKNTTDSTKIKLTKSRFSQ